MTRLLRNSSFCFSLLGVAALFILDSFTKTLDDGDSTFFPSTFSLPLEYLSLVVSSSFFSSLALLKLGFFGD